MFCLALGGAGTAPALEDPVEQQRNDPETESGVPSPSSPACARAAASGLWSLSSRRTEDCMEYMFALASGRARTTAMGIWTTTDPVELWQSDP